MQTRCSYAHEEKAEKPKNNNLLIGGIGVVLLAVTNAATFFLTPRSALASG